ncbi:hypothetical protein RAZWK3B_16605 [Roseobacter sp. AzwK-3b]|uniref:hypothetical protein n=1 Tax=Roseobacter sp. AzwK-3b TaxID=351016 RepID=UPI000156987A|nr:hypothetical protein [Roseobacter sp. AzwK-3b]EDM71036.1 hypothetical protein RAZWK3B_16605 [Roseobacter sp. AzwK-3b]
MTVFIQKGDAPMSYRQAVKRGLRYFEAEKAYWQREQGIVQGDTAYKAWAAQWVDDNVVNEANNIFNHQLAAYRAALGRLDQYILADGRPEVTEEQETGQFDPETGEPITEAVVVQSAIDPVEPTVEQAVYDETTGEQTGTETVTNPLIVKDEAERAEAQAVIAATPAEVVTFHDALNV